MSPPEAPGESLGDRTVIGPATALTAADPESKSQIVPTLRHLAILTLLAAVYFMVGKFGLQLAVVNPSATAVWAPTGIALAALLSLGYRVWPAIFVGAFLVNVTTAGSIATSIGIASGNTLEGLIGAYLVSRFANGKDAFDRAQDTFSFALLAGMVSPAISATLGVTSLTLAGYASWAAFGPIWLTWWLGDMGGALTVAPLVILWIRDHHLRWSRARVLEAAILLVLLVAVGELVFGPFLPVGGGGFPLKFACTPLLVWAAYRFDPRMAATAVFVFAATAVWGALRITGPIAGLDRNQVLLLLQVFMGVNAVTALALAATVSERSRVEERIRAVSEALREAVTEMEAFSHSISHDLRSPLGAVLNYLTIIEQDHHGRLDDQGTRLLRGVRTSTESAVRLLDQLVHLAWVGPEAGEKQDVDMTSLAREIYAEVASGGGEPAQVHFELRELPVAHGGRALLGRVFSNLFSNAMKYTRGRENRRIEVYGEAGEQENTYCVADNGIGFDPQHADAVFQPFRRLNSGHDASGSGLGLAIVAKIIRRHGGRTWAESDGSNGARFCFTLPNRKGSA